MLRPTALDGRVVVVDLSLPEFEKGVRM